MSLTLLFIVLIVVSNAAGDVFITRGMKKMGEVSSLSPRVLLGVAWQALTDRDFLLGVFSLAVSFFSFIAVLSWADMSFVVPATSVVYAVTVFGARFVLKEKISPMRWAGTILVCLGVALVSIP